MKKLAIFSAIALAACSGGDEAATDDAATETAAVETPAAVPAGGAADGGASHGTYTITQADGTVYTYAANEDGTYAVTDAAGAEIETGTWRQDGPNRFCETAAEATEEECFTETVDEAGVWTSVSEADATDTSTIVRVN